MKVSVGCFNLALFVVGLGVLFYFVENALPAFNIEEL